MLRYFLTRLAGAVPTLFIIVTISFFLIRAAPGGPFDQEQTLPPEILANLESAYGLDQPILTQYGRYLAALAHGDFGPGGRWIRRGRLHHRRRRLICTRNAAGSERQS